MLPHLFVVEPAGLAAYHEVAMFQADLDPVPDLRGQGHDTPTVMMMRESIRQTSTTGRRSTGPQVCVVEGDARQP